MKTFGTSEIVWRSVHDKNDHAIVATKGSAWQFLCRADPADYVTWDNTVDEPSEKPTAEPLVWKHDRTKVTCPNCGVVLDSATVTPGAAP